MFFGAVRAYKNVAGLVQAFRRVKAPDAILYIVGQPNSAILAREIQEEASQDSRVRIKFEFVEPKDTATYLDTANLVVLPYRDVLNSGSALLSLSCSRPILVPNLGSMSELQKEFGEDWVRTFNGPLNENILEHGLEWAAWPRPSVCPMPEKYEWKSIGERTVKFYGDVVDGSERNVRVEAI
jgi:glycosyltransferase involved in cell wall biosynthesis